MPSPRLTLIVCAALASLAMAGCGSSDGTSAGAGSDRSVVASSPDSGSAGGDPGAGQPLGAKETARVFYRALVAGQAHEACELLTARYRVEFVRTAQQFGDVRTCVEAANVVGALAGDTEVTHARVTGNTAEVRAQTGANTPVTLTLVRRDGAWRIDADD